jgi:hypothetical protein
MSFTVANLDAQIKFLRGEAEYLRKNHKGLFWAENKAAQFDLCADALREWRQERQMRGMDGKRIEDQP